ncbi:SDR family oxidoreductase [Dyadobacter sp. CY345]|uniref:SDR family oxidoreductase n=1 Tax=Dyadobacter sp. CY345 TaxID=2909335 RepID=UPI001F48F399|nr:SDR family oxidoreductase [Dyadobacter sp. CY345]MCF2446192.1 SDR family oxidoreductase [Dyadobacter sp. CY345]
MINYNTHHSLSIEGKIILITGAFGMIGKTIAMSFLEQGALVILADIDTDKKGDLENLLTRRFTEDRFLLQQLDITNEESCQNAINTILGKFGRLDVLINNAAIDAKFDKIHPGSVNQSRFENYPIDLLQKSIETNLTGTILITQHVCRVMMKQGFGNIINVASTYSVVAPNQSLYDYGDQKPQFKPVDYVASKSFIPNFTRYLATFYAHDNIRCNAIVPHGIANDHGKKFVENFAKLSPLGRMCEREELIGPFTFLASDASSYMTGSLLTVDGGWTAW